MRIRQIISISALGTLVALLFSCAHPIAGSGDPSLRSAPASVPDDLQVSGSVLLHVKAQGVQIYTCVTDPAGELTWSAAVPQADFVSDDGIKGKHFKGPTWQLDSGAKIVGRKLREHAAPDPSSIPWLLLAVTSHDGDGPFASTVFVQRLNTTGGKAPPISDQKAGEEIRVPYTAEYIFYGPASTTRPWP